MKHIRDPQQTQLTLCGLLLGYSVSWWEIGEFVDETCCTECLKARRAVNAAKLLEREDQNLIGVFQETVKARVTRLTIRRQAVVTQKAVQAIVDDTAKDFEIDRDYKMQFHLSITGGSDVELTVDVKANVT